MASRITLAGQSQIVGAHVPVAVLLSAIPSLPRHALNRLVEQMIDRMDGMDGDPDFEPDGDETDQSFPEATGPRGHVIDGRAAPFEDDEDSHDCEQVEEREIEDFIGGQANIPFDGLFRGGITA